MRDTAIVTGNPLRIATRKSRLARWQSQHVAAALTARDGALRTELLPLTTQGDRFVTRPLADVGGKSLFVKELEAALLDGAADIAVHSLKDLPAELPRGLVIAAVMARATPADALVSNRFGAFAELPAGAVVGTSSLRRACQLAHHRRDLCIKPLRGNVDTRLAKLDAGDYDAIVLACAGLERLGHARRIREALPPEIMLPAIGQGAIAVECRRDAEVYERVRTLNDDTSERCVNAERALSLRLGGDCRLPLAAHAVCSGREVRLRALVGAADGGKVLRAEAKSPLQQPRQAGIAAAEDLLAQGAGELLSGFAGADWSQSGD